LLPINLQQDKGILIYQQDPKIHTKWEVTAWIKEYPREGDEFWASTCVVFNCNLTRENAKIFEQILEAWIQPDCRKVEIEALIDDLIN
jgi:hypothetical protein